MDATEKQREHVAILCQKTGTTANLITKDCDALLQEANEPLNEEQIVNIGTIRKASQKLRSIADEVNQAISNGIPLWAEQEETSYFMTVLAHDLKDPIMLILGFSQVNLKGITGSLSDRQKETMEHIHRLGHMLTSSIEESLLRANGIFKEL